MRGASTKQISQVLYISEYTVQDHLSNVFEKVGGSGLRAWAWDVVFVVGGRLGTLIAARYYVAGVLERDRLLARSAAAMFFLFTIPAVLYFWRFW